MSSDGYAERRARQRRRISEGLSDIKRGLFPPKVSREDDVRRSMERVDREERERNTTYRKPGPGEGIAGRIGRWQAEREEREYQRDLAAIPKLKARNERLRLADQESALRTRISNRERRGDSGWGLVNSMMGNAAHNMGFGSPEPRRRSKRRGDSGWGLVNSMMGNAAHNMGFGSPEPRRRSKPKSRGGGKTIVIHVDGEGKNKPRKRRYSEGGGFPF